MLSLVVALAVACIVPGHSQAQDPVDDSAVKGLWLTVPSFIKVSEFSDLEFDAPGGPASYTRSLTSGSLWMTIERLESIEYGEDAIKAAIIEWEGEYGMVSNLKVWADEKLSELYTYPVFRADYTTGANEDTSDNHALIMYTDPFTFRINILVDADYAGGYTDDEFDPKWIDSWFSGIEIRE